MESKLSANNFSMIHINIASISKHIDELRGLLTVLYHPFDIPQLKRHVAEQVCMLNHLINLLSNKISLSHVVTYLNPHSLKLKEVTKMLLLGVFIYNTPLYQLP